MSETRMPITPQGLEKMKVELKRLKSQERPRIVKEIEVARAHGDLSENAEYQYAKDQQGLIEARIKDLEGKIGMAEVIDPTKLSGDRVMFGATVTLYDVNEDKEETIQIVGAEESDIENGRISIDSAIAKAIIGKSLDDEVKVKTPKGIREMEIVAVEYKS